MSAPKLQKQTSLDSARLSQSNLLKRYQPKTTSQDQINQPPADDTVVAKFSSQRNLQDSKLLQKYQPKPQSQPFQRAQSIDPNALNTSSQRSLEQSKLLQRYLSQGSQEIEIQDRPSSRSSSNSRLDTSKLLQQKYGQKSSSQEFLGLTGRESTPTYGPDPSFKHHSLLSSYTPKFNKPLDLTIKPDERQYSSQSSLDRRLLHDITPEPELQEFTMMEHYEPGYKRRNSSNYDRLTHRKSAQDLEIPVKKIELEIEKENVENVSPVVTDQQKLVEHIEHATTTASAAPFFIPLPFKVPTPTKDLKESPTLFTPIKIEESIPMIVDPIPVPATKEKKKKKKELKVPPPPEIVVEAPKPIASVEPIKPVEEPFTFSISDRMDHYGGAPMEIKKPIPVKALEKPMTDMSSRNSMENFRKHDIEPEVPQSTPSMDLTEGSGRDELSAFSKPDHKRPLDTPLFSVFEKTAAMAIPVALEESEKLELEPIPKDRKLKKRDFTYHPTFKTKDPRPQEEEPKIEKKRPILEKSKSVDQAPVSSKRKDDAWLEDLGSHRSLDQYRVGATKQLFTRPSRAGSGGSQNRLDQNLSATLPLQSSSQSKLLQRYNVRSDSTEETLKEPEPLQVRSSSQRSLDRMSQSKLLQKYMKPENEPVEQKYIKPENEPVEKKSSSQHSLDKISTSKLLQKYTKRSESTDNAPKSPMEGMTQKSTSQRSLDQIRLQHSSLLQKYIPKTGLSKIEPIEPINARAEKSTLLSRYKPRGMSEDRANFLNDNERRMSPVIFKTDRTQQMGYERDHEYEPIGEPVETAIVKKEEPKATLKLPADDADNISMEELQKQIEERYYNLETPETTEPPAVLSEAGPEEKTSKMKKFMKQAQDSSKNLGNKVKEGSKSVGKTMQRQMSTGADKIKTRMTSMTSKKDKTEKADVPEVEEAEEAEEAKMEVEQPEEVEGAVDTKKTFKQKLKDGNKSAGKWVQQVGKSTHDKFGAGADIIKTKVTSMTANMKKDKVEKPEEEGQKTEEEGQKTEEEGQKPEEIESASEPKEPKEETEEANKSIQQKIKDGSKNVFQKTKEGGKLFGEKVSAGADIMKTKMSSMTSTLKKEKKHEPEVECEAGEEKAEIGEAERESSVEPRKKRFKTPDLKKLHVPEFAKKIPEKFNSLRLNRSKSLKEPEDSEELVHGSSETPEPLAGHVTTKKKMNLNFGTYPRLLKDKLKRQESAPAGSSSIHGSTPPPRLDETMMPPKRHQKPKWTEKLSEDADSERFGPFSGSEFEMERELSVERRMREHFERMQEFEGAPMTEEQKQLEEYDKENREIHMLTQARQDEVLRRKAPMERQESDLASEEERQFWASSLGQKIRRNIDANDNESDYLDEVDKLAIEKDKLGILVPEPKKGHEYVDDLGNISDQENASSGGSSSLRRRKGVLEEIDDDEFFLRKRGVSEGNSEIGQYISTAIKEGLTSNPVNALAEMGRYDQYYDDEENKLKGRYKYYQPSFESDDLSHENVPRPYYDNFFQSFPPNRPTRKARKFDNEYEEDLPYDEDQPEIVVDEGSAEDDEKIIKPVFVPPTPPRRRKKKFRDLTPIDHGTDDIFLRTPVQQNGSAQHGIDIEIEPPLAEEEIFSIPTPSPRRSRSRSRSQLSNRIEDDRTSRGADSFILDSNEVISDEKFVVHLPVDANSGYAVIKKDRSPSQPRPNAPVRRKKSTRSLGERQFNTLPHIKSEGPLRPSRNYSTINPNRPPRSKSFSDNKDKPDSTEYEVIDDVDNAVHKALQSGAVVNKMKDRPLPPPPRPPRDSRSKSKSKKMDDEDLDFGGGGEKIVPGLKQISEVEAYTQTDTRASDFEDYDPEVAEATLPMKTLEELLKDEQEAELERDKQLAENLTKGLEKFRQSSQKSFSERSGRASKSPYGSRPETPAALIIERKISTPTIFQNKEETLTKATLLMRPIDIDAIEDDLMDEQDIARLDDDNYIAEIVRKYVRDTSFDKEEEELKAEEKRLAIEKPEKSAISTQLPQEEALEMQTLMVNLAAKEKEVIDQYIEEPETVEEPVIEEPVTIEHAEEVVFSQTDTKTEKEVPEKPIAIDQEIDEKDLAESTEVFEPVEAGKAEVFEPESTDIFEPIDVVKTEVFEPVEVVKTDVLESTKSVESIQEVIVDEKLSKIEIDEETFAEESVTPITQELEEQENLLEPVEDTEEPIESVQESVIETIEPIKQTEVQKAKPVEAKISEQPIEPVEMPKEEIPISYQIEFKEELLETPKFEPIIEQIAITSNVEIPKDAALIIEEIQAVEPEIEQPNEEITLFEKYVPQTSVIDEPVEVNEEVIVEVEVPKVSEVKPISYEPPQRPPKKQAPPPPPPVPAKEQPIQEPKLDVTELKDDEEVVIQEEAPQKEVSPPRAPPRRRPSAGDVTQFSMAKPQEIVISEDQPLIKGRLHLNSLEIDTLSVSSLQARKISVSEMETGTITTQSIDSTAKLPAEPPRPIEIPVGLIEEIVERLRTSEQKHREELDQKRRQEDQERETERIEKEKAMQKTKPEEKHISVQTDQIEEHVKEPVQVPVVDQPKKLPEAPTEEVPQRPPLPQIPQQMPQMPYIYPTEYLQYGVPPQAYFQMRNMSDDDSMLPQAPQRRRRLPRATRKDSTSEEEIQKERKSRHGTRSPGPSTAPPPSVDPTIPELSGQLVMACGVAAKQAGTDLMGMLRASSKDENKRDLHIALVILIIIVAGLMAMGMSAEKAVHHHHWDYFNPPGSDGN